MAVAFVSATQGLNTNVVSKPASVALGDLLVIFYEDDGGRTGSLTGWTGIGPIKYNAAAHSFGILWKIATSTEVAASNFTVSNLAAGTYSELLCCRFTGTDQTTPINASLGTSDSSTTAGVSPTVTNTLRFAVLTWDGGSTNASAPVGWTRDLNGNGTYNMWAAEKALSASGASGSQSFSSTGSGGVAIYDIAIAPPSGGTSVSGTDTGTGADTQSISASSTQTDTGSGSEATAKIAFGQTDTGGGTEGTPTIGQTWTDTGAGADAQTLAISSTITDTGTGAEAWSITVTQTQTDVGSGADSFSLATGGGPATQTDAGTGVDSQSISITSTQADTGSGLEGTPSIRQTATDTGAGTETGKVSQTLTDVGVGAEAWSITVTLSQTDTGVLDDVFQIAGNSQSISQVDGGVGSESWTVSVGHPASSTFTKLNAYGLQQRLADMRRNSIPRPRPNRWPGGRP